MDDYLKLGHMELIPENEIDVPACSSFYLPHHPVPNKNGDKFRVVFDGSAKSSSGISLNDKLMVGPQLQTDLTTLLLRFRMHKIAITTDIEKMYRQITLHDSDFQRIVWRNSPFEPIQDFRLTRIAYGTASVPYLAIKCLQQLALNESNNFPLASKAALKDFYVDDLMAGANSLSEALELQNQLTQMVSSARLVLRKWASNCSKLLNSINSDMSLSNTSLNINNDDTVKTLGILWHPASDVFYFKITPLSFEGTLTERTLLSTIAKTFDPLGWLSPITIQYKTIMQRLWKQQLKWDERVPTDIKLEWEQLANDVQFVKDIKIPRFLLVDSDNLFHLFGFSDASEKAYAAAIYCRSVSYTGKINVQLIIAKTRVAPLKTVSLPRLELCGALFRWKTFVANRVAKIQTLSSATQWHHISGSANPADLVTRGLSSSTLLTSIWLCGPKFLHETFPFQTDSSVPALNDAVPEESISRPTHLGTSTRVPPRESCRRTCRERMGSTFRHKHLYTFHKFWDINDDGVLTWEDFRQLAEKYTKIQRRGKLDEDVFKRWESILGKWWDELTHHADFNKDAVVEFDEWLRFFHNLGTQTKSHKELPDFLQTYLQLFFFIMDSNKDGLFCVKDYKKYLTAHNMDVTRAKECFDCMLNVSNDLHFIGCDAAAILPGVS
ncbi:pro-Pol polyprotein [Trichonephila clavata]|uniref:Pro-Pol polyprotein n=1 Tax=Trichonephila clavata TaxID=2740835 RepID=A0A8X6H2A6_TRICU|nr:pro-Pol polyprotein [Trichonephila clavata]